MHIPKTAGMSLQGLVRRRYKKAGSLALIYSQQEVEQGFEDHPGLETVMGHYRFGFHKFSQRQPRYFTFLRDPIQQVISHYYYSLEHPEKFPDLPAGIEDVIDFAHCRYGYNLQTRFVSGMDDIRGKEDLALHEAKHNLTHHFEMVGITEQFDKSLLLLGRHFNWKTLFYLKGNAGKKKSISPGASAEEIRKLESILEPDIKLYQLGLEIFNIECLKAGDLNLNLSLFKLGNRIFRSLNPSYIRLKKMLGRNIEDPHS
jgi:hypothetical protein